MPKNVNTEDTKWKDCFAGLFYDKLYSANQITYSLTRVLRQCFMLDNSYKTLLIEPHSTVQDVCRAMAGAINHTQTPLDRVEQLSIVQKKLASTTLRMTRSAFR